MKRGENTATGGRGKQKMERGGGGGAEGGYWLIGRPFVRPQKPAHGRAKAEQDGGVCFCFSQKKTEMKPRLAGEGKNVLHNHKNGPPLYKKKRGGGGGQWAGTELKEKKTPHKAS